MTITHTMIGATAVAALMLAAAPGFAQTQTSPSSPPPYDTAHGAQSTPASPGQMQQGNMPSGTTGSSMSSSATGTATMVPLSQVQNPATTLASAQVQDSSGQTVGQVQNVQTTSSGTVSKINVTLSSGSHAGKTVIIPARDLRFDQGGNILKARLTQSEIEKLQGSSSTNPM